jgi:uncharacterized membrane protein
VARHSGRASPLPIVAAVVLLVIVAVAIAPRDTTASVGRVDFDAVRKVVHERCTSCHAASPKHPAFQAAPAGVVLETDVQIVAEALRIHHQTVVTRVMPIGNLTDITEEERDVIDRWYRAGAGAGE